jgi:cytidylate kinase
VKKQTITIDGPAGAGKSTVAKAIAEALGYTYLDTGAMYRAVAWKGLQEGIPPEDEEAYTRLANEMEIRFATTDKGQRVFVDGVDVTEALRTPEVTRLSSPVSAISGVRRVLVAQQQQMGRCGGVVAEGRDTGTVVFPDAEVKIFLTASEEERARRRWLERVAQGERVTLEEILVQQRQRDQRDSSRADSPLRPADEAVWIDTTHMTREAVIQRILELCRTRRRNSA